MKKAFYRMFSFATGAGVSSRVKKSEDMMSSGPSPAAAATVDLQHKFAELGRLFAAAIGESAQSVSKSVEDGGAGIDFPQLRAQSDKMATDVNRTLAEIRTAVAALPGIDKTTAELLEEIKEEERQNQLASEELLAAEAEAKRCLAVVSESEQRLAEAVSARSR